MSNLEIWDKLRTPPKEVLKTINSGRLQGMTDIKPQWRYQAMTEQFGMCGIGWKYTIDRQRIEDGVGEHKFAFVDVSLFVKVNGEWSEAIPGNGGSMLIAKEKSGPHMNDEAFKMATTDALSVAMSRIGVGADIYMGQAYQSKYSSPAPSMETAKQKQSMPKKSLPVGSRTDEQAKQILEVGKKLNLTAEIVGAIINWKYSGKPLTVDDADFVIHNLEIFANEYREEMNQMKELNQCQP